LFSAGGAPALAQDQGPPVSAVIASSTGANPATATPMIDALKAIDTYVNGFKGNPCKNRLLQATFAGSNSGEYVVVIECPSMEALARRRQMLNADAQFRKLTGDLGAKRAAAGGKTLSQSIYEEVR
jgi:hypothetical protein